MKILIPFALAVLAAHAAAMPPELADIVVGANIPLKTKRLPTLPPPGPLVPTPQGPPLPDGDKMVEIEPSRLVAITLANVSAEVIRSEKPVVLLYCSAQSCDKLTPIMEHLAAQNPSHKFGVVDLERDPALRREAQGPYIYAFGKDRKFRKLKLTLYVNEDGAVVGAGLSPAKPQTAAESSGLIEPKPK